MSTERSSNPVKTLSSAAAVVSVVVGIIVLVGWTFDIGVLKSILPGWFPMKVNAAFCFILTGVALWLTVQPALILKLSFSRLLAKICIVLVSLVGMLTLSEYTFGWNMGIDQWLFSEPAGAVGTLYPGRMAQEAALNFVLLSVVLWIANGKYKSRWAVLITVMLGLLVTLLSLAAALSYLTPGLGAYGWFGLSVMALHAAMTFAILGSAVVAISWRSDVLPWSMGLRTTVVFACGMIVLILIGFNISRSQFWLKEANRQIAYNEEVLANMSEIVTDVIDAHAHTRGYVITGDARFKNDFLDAIANSRTKLDTLEKLVAHQPHSQQLVEQILVPINAEIQWLQRGIDSESMPISATARNKMIFEGEVLLKEMRNQFEQIRSEHQRHIQQMKQNADNALNILYLIVFIGTLLSLVIFMAVIFKLNIALNARRQEEKERRASEAFKSSIIDSSSDCIKVISRDGLLKYMSLGGQTLLEIEDINQYLGKSWIDFWSADMQSNVREALFNAASGEAGHFQGYSPTAKGSPKWWDVIITPIRGEDGVINDMLATSRDITQSLQAQQKIVEQMDFLQRFQTIAIKREFRMKELQVEIEKLKAEIEGLKHG
jgi:PAS domain S-box-containing protein